MGDNRSVRVKKPWERLIKGQTHVHTHTYTYTDAQGWKGHFVQPPVSSCLKMDRDHNKQTQVGLAKATLRTEETGKTWL